MQFTYTAYKDLLKEIRVQGYDFASYKDWEDKPRCVILRHDIDNDIEKAESLAKIEKDLGIKSTYFVLVTSDFYNVFSARNEELLRQIAGYGHTIGLHFDEIRYPEIKTPEDASDRILEEANILSHAIGSTVDIVSMHRPSKMMLDADLKIPGMINSYGQAFFKGFKYVSDSRKRWREPVEEIIREGNYNRLHILTHAIWYDDIDITIHDSLFKFINSGNIQRYVSEQSNITDLHTIMGENEVLHA